MTSLVNDVTPYIVSPFFPLEWRDVEDFLGEFGPYNGRYVPRYPHDWEKMLRQHLEEMDTSPVKRAAHYEKLRREAALCTTPVDWAWDATKTWGRNVGALSDKTEQANIVGDAVDPTPFQSWGDLTRDIKRSRCRSWSFHGSVSDYVRLITPLLLNSTTAYLIDPYLDPCSTTFENLLLSLFQRMKGSKCYRLELITRQSACGNRKKEDPKTWMSFGEIESSFQTIYSHALPKDRTLKLHLIEEIPARDEFLKLHDRFFLTEHGAINFGQGFLMGKKQAAMNAFLVDKPHHDFLKDQYINGVSLYHDKRPIKKSVASPKNVISFEVGSR